MCPKQKWSRMFGLGFNYRSTHLPDFYSSLSLYAGLKRQTAGEEINNTPHLTFWTEEESSA